MNVRPHLPRGGIPEISEFHDFRHQRSGEIETTLSSPSAALAVAGPVDNRMKSKDRKSPPTDSRRAGVPESPQSNETFPRRTDPPAKAGLANENRPGSGTRSDEPSPSESQNERANEHRPRAVGDVAKRQRSGREPNDKPAPRDPQEQSPDSWAQETERSTGVSGHSSST
jgi:hypothetical protein